jgi:hypothetical protein
MVAPKQPGKPGKKEQATPAQEAASRDANLTASEEVAEQIGELEARVEQLKIHYDQYFLGLERAPPIQERDSVKAAINRVKSTYIRNTAQRFRVQSLFQKLLSYERMWMRISREMEEGTYSRDLFKARLRNQKKNDKKKDKSKEKKAEAEAPLEKEETTDPHIVLPQEMLEGPPLVRPAPVAGSGNAADPPLIRPNAVPPTSSGRPPPPPPEALGQRPGAPGNRPPTTTPPPPPVEAGAVVRQSSSGLPAVRGSGTAPGVPGKGPPPPPKPETGPAVRQSAAGLPAVRPGVPPTAPGARATAAAPGSGNASGLTDDKMKAIYNALVAAKRQCKESTDGITYESVARTINTQMPELMKQHNAKAVDFKVVIKNGKATLKAVPRS